MRFKKRESTPLGEKNIDLGRYVKEYEYCSPLFIRDDDVCYLAFAHAVEFRAVIPHGLQGYFMKPVPKRIKTVESLLKYMSKNMGCTIREDVVFSNEKPPFIDDSPIIKPYQY